MPTTPPVIDRHAHCERVECDACPDEFDCCEMAWSDARSRWECGDCHQAAEQAADDDAEWRHYAYH